MTRLATSGSFKILSTNFQCISLHILNLTILTPEQLWNCSSLLIFRAKAANYVFPSQLSNPYTKPCCFRCFFPRHAMHSWFDDGWLQHWDEWLSSLPLNQRPESGWSLTFLTMTPHPFFSGRPPLKDDDVRHVSCDNLLLKALVFLEFFLSCSCFSKEEVV